VKTKKVGKGGRKVGKGGLVSRNLSK
jgi:hypothetical protein